MKNKKKLLGIVVLVVLIAAMAVLYGKFKEKPVEGSKSITIEVVNSKEESKVYEMKTDAEFLKQAMEEAEGLTFDGEEKVITLSTCTSNEDIRYIVQAVKKDVEDDGL